MTTIPEKRREIDLIAGFLVVVLGLAAFRGASGAPALAALAAIGAVGVLVAWVRWRRKPRPFLAISPHEIFYGRLDQPGTVIARGSSGRLAFRKGFRSSGWFLLPADEPDGPGISMIGFDVREVEAACVASGWRFGDPDLTT